jgi:phenylalanyl-tRNA synthetase beta chain
VNVSYAWLKELVDFDLSPEGLAQKLTFIGLEVERLSQVGDDWCIELELTSNRPDCLSIVGVAREVSVACGRELRIPDCSVSPGDEETGRLTSVEILDTGLCPRYTAQIIRNVKIEDSPDWLKQRLEVIGVRPVNNVVDATNFVTMELGQPLHAFDYDKLSENRIVVRRAKEGESVTAINGKSYPLAEQMLAICDAREPVAIAGVMGGLFSEVTGRTKNILLESAYFDPLSVRSTSRSLALESAASYRFERGVDPELVLPASLRCARLILELAGGELSREPVDVGVQKLKYGEAKLRFKRILELIGYDVAPDRAVEIFEALGLKPKKRTRTAVTVSVPPRRLDIEREADLVEEVLRHEGIDRVPLVEIPSSDLQPEPRQRFLTAARERMCGFGFYELLTDSFVPDSAAGKMTFFEAGEPLGVRNPVTVQRPLLRRSLVPNMLDAFRAGGSRAEGAAGMFEVSVVYLPGPVKLPREMHALAFLCPEGYPAAKGTLEVLLESLRVRGVSFGKYGHPALEAGRASLAAVDGRPFAFVGVLSQETAAAYDVAGDCAVCEMDLDFLYSLSKDKVAFAPIPRFPKVLRDMAVVVDEPVLWQELRDEIGSLGINLLARVEMFDIYRGEQLPKGRKSVAFSLEFQSPDRTLRGEEVDELIGRIASHLGRRFAAELRK